MKANAVLLPLLHVKIPKLVQLLKFNLELFKYKITISITQGIKDPLFQHVELYCSKVRRLMYLETGSYVVA